MEIEPWKADCKGQSRPSRLSTRGRTPTTGTDNNRRRQADPTPGAVMTTTGRG